MSAASKAFLADPMAFMSRNIVIIDNGEGQPRNSKEQNFDLINDGEGLNSKGGKIPVYRLQKAEAGAKDPIPAYWLAFVDGEIESKILDTSRNIFFTAGMSGCGFAAGSGAKPVVKHIDGGKYRNDEMIDDPSNAGMDIYTQANYASTEKGYGTATVFGVKGKVAWKFMAQAQLKIDGTHTLRFPEGIMPV
jgi:hypothetical protein